MNKFFVLLCVPAASIEEWMKNVDETTRKQQTDEMMKSWQEWTTKHEAAIVDKGTSVGKTKRVTSSGATDARNEVNWYLVVEAESHEAAVEMFIGHPHLVIPAAYIDISSTKHPEM
ncbi:MAG: hypothetical protein JWO50_807 [Candidatus Kaiserbacteria bacterium]|nr:hypothetical protein [Candidatus Kaiserbacteria bacterium]